MHHTISVAFNAMAVGMNIGIVLGGGIYDPLAVTLGIAICGSLMVAEIVKAARKLSPNPS
jgi:hypothetical protein